MSEKTIFSKIISGELPSTKIYEDENVLAFLDIAPNNFGHTQVIPKKSYIDFLELPDEEIKNLFLIAKKISKAMKDGLGATGINLVMNNGTDAGQEIFHAHIHVIPRFPDDELHYDRHLKYVEGQKEEVAEKIKRHL